MVMKKLSQMWIFVLIVCSITVIATWIAIPENLFINITLSTVSFLIASYFLFIKREDLFHFVKSPYFKRLSNSMIGLFLVFCIVALINFMGYKRPFAKDISKQKVNTLSDQSMRVMDMLPGPVQIKLYTKKNFRQRFESLIELYRLYKNDIKVDFVDIDKNFYQAKADNIQAPNSIKVTYNKRSIVSEIKNELSITNTFLRLTRETRLRVLMTTGHGEISLATQGNEGIKVFSTALNNNFYSAEPVDLNSITSIQSDSLFILGPTLDFTTTEIQKLKTYYDNGGKIFITLDPEIKGTKLNNLRAFLFENGVKVNNDIVVDRLSTTQGLDATAILSKSFNKKHVITKGMNKRVLLPLTSSMLPVNQKGVEYQPLIYTSNFPASWAESDLKQLSSGKVTFNDKEDMKGPVTIAAALQKGQSRLVVFGTSRFLIDGYQNQSNNLNMALNISSWLMQEEGIIALNRPGLKSERIFMTNAQVNLIFYFTIIVMPLLMLGTAVFTYRRRKAL
jgi:ABC-type uncharacterized transport system involved in gliding motility auxiliary subunit